MDRRLNCKREAPAWAIPPNFNPVLYFLSGISSRHNPIHNFKPCGFVLLLHLIMQGWVEVGRSLTGKPPFHIGQDLWKTLKIYRSLNDLSVNFQWSPGSFMIPKWSFSEFHGLPWCPKLFWNGFKIVFHENGLSVVFQQSFSDLSMSAQRSY